MDEENRGRGRDDNFHRNEAISAVADEGFFGEEDDDYEDLYNDVNVGEGFYQTLRRNENIEQNRDSNADDSAPAMIPPGVPDHPSGAVATSSVAATGGGSESIPNKDVSVPVNPSPNNFPLRLDSSSQNLGFKVNETVPQKGFEPVPVPPSGEYGESSGKMGSGGIRVELRDWSANKPEENRPQIGVGSNVQPQEVVQQASAVVSESNRNEGFVRRSGGAVTITNGYGGGVGAGAGGGGGTGAGGTILFVGELHWWTTDAELEEELSKYGTVKEVKFFDEKASGKSKGYCQVEFYDPAAATACKEGMNGHPFNGRPCVVAYATPFTVRRMGEAQAQKNQQISQSNNFNQGRRGQGDAGGRGGGSNAPGVNFQGGDGGRSNGRGSMGRGNAQGMGYRGQVGPGRSRGGGIGGRGIMGNGGNNFGQGLSAASPLLPPQAMMSQGFDPAYGPNMGRMSGYGGFPAPPAPPFPGMMPSFPSVGGVGLPGVAPHVNPAFFGRGMPPTGMTMIPGPGVDGHGMVMWPDPNAAGWGGEEQGGRAGDSSYGEDAASDQQYGKGSHERGGWQGSSMKEKERTSERDWSGPPERRYKDDREMRSDRDVPKEKDVAYNRDWSERRHHEERDMGRERDRDHSRERKRSQDRDRDRDREKDRDRYREDREKYMDHHRDRNRDMDYDDEWEKERSSRTYSKSRPSQDEDYHARSRDAEYAKRRR
ncbi:RNA recognition motif domain [Dillenia turbinata]|uniref:RNA recognition motif domain n=1 Tax=Dillenia turbinata TaxID=194707 RepID=A0AAN8VJK9_9MAGN